MRMNEQNQWHTGTSLRMSRLFDETHKTGVVVAVDHAFGGVHSGLEKPAEVLEKIIAGGPDGVILTPGTARNFQSMFSGRQAPAMIISLDYVLFHPYPGAHETIEEQGLVNSVQKALRLGADAVKLLMIFGREDPGLQARNFDAVGRLVEECQGWGLPVMVEPTTWGERFKNQEKKNAKLLRDMVRIAFEFGADMVKSDYPIPAEDFSLISGSCPAPVFVLGGAQQDDKKLLKDVVTLMKQGAAGVTFGRNIWQHQNPEAMIRSLKHCVYRQDLEAALHELHLPGASK